jgi:hypothetical protein
MSCPTDDLLCSARPLLDSGAGVRAGHGGCWRSDPCARATVGEVRSVPVDRKATATGPSAGGSRATSGWDVRLWGLWALYNGIAYLVVLSVAYGLAVLASDVHASVTAESTVLSLAVATLGALLNGYVLGSMQMRVIRQRAHVDRRRWITACIGPALVGWLFVVLPAVTSASKSGGSVPAAYLYSVSQTLALGPLLGLSQAIALRTKTSRWAWWIPANIVSYALVAGAAYLLSRTFPALDFTKGSSSPLGVYVELLATTPLTGRALLWVLAPSALAAHVASPTPDRSRKSGLRQSRERPADVR